MRRGGGPGGGAETPPRRPRQGQEPHPQLLPPLRRRDQGPVGEVTRRLTGEGLGGSQRAYGGFFGAFVIEG